MRTDKRDKIIMAVGGGLVLLSPLALAGAYLVAGRTLVLLLTALALFVGGLAVFLVGRARQWWRD